MFLPPWRDPSRLWDYESHTYSSKVLVVGRRIGVFPTDGVPRYWELSTSNRSGLQDKLVERGQQEVPQYRVQSHRARGTRSEFHSYLEGPPSTEVDVNYSSGKKDQVKGTKLGHWFGLSKPSFLWSLLQHELFHDRTRNRNSTGK